MSNGNETPTTAVPEGVTEILCSDVVVGSKTHDYDLIEPDQIETITKVLKDALVNIDKLKDDAKFNLYIKGIADLQTVVEGYLLSLERGGNRVGYEVVQACYMLNSYADWPGGEYAKFYQSEAPYLVKNGEATQEQLDHIQPVINQAFVSMYVEGHSGGSYGFHRSVFIRTFDRAIQEVRKRQDGTPTTWKALEQFELEASGCANAPETYAFNYAFNATAHLELTLSDLELLKKIVGGCLNFKPLTKLTLDESEWNNVTEMMGRDGNESHYQNRRCSSIFKILYEDGTDFIYNLDDGPRFTDNDPQADIWFTRGGPSSRVEFNPDLPLASQRYAIFLKWADDQEQGTTPDGEWDRYNYIPELPEVPEIGTYLRQYNFITFKVVGHVFEDGELVSINLAAPQSDEVIKVLSVVDYHAVGQFKEFKYPMYSVYDPEYYSRKGDNE